MSRMTAFLRCLHAAAWPTCSCTSTYMKTAKCKTVAIFGLGNRFCKTRWFIDDEGLRLRTITCWLPCVFFSFGPSITASDSYQSRRRSLVLLRSISPMPGSDAFILIVDVSSPKCFVQPGDHHSCQASNTGCVLKKRKGIFKKILKVGVGVGKKMPGDRAEFPKRAPRHRQDQSPSARRFGAVMPNLTPPPDLASPCQIRQRGLP